MRSKDTPIKLNHPYMANEEGRDLSILVRDQFPVR